MRIALIKFAFAGLMLLGLVSSTNADRTIYVNAASSGGTDGATWATAYTDLQDAFDDIRTNGDCPCQIWIASGVYTPDRGTGDRFLAFEPPGGVSLYGGFAGTEKCIDERDWNAHESVLSGDLLDNDEFEQIGESSCCHATREPGCDDPECEAAVVQAWRFCADDWDGICVGNAMRRCCSLCRPTRCENSAGLVRVEQSAGTVVLDGLTFRNGYRVSDGSTANPVGGGIFADQSSIVIRNCTFLRNEAAQGAAIYTWMGDAIVDRCLFRENQGAVVTHALNQASVSNCQFIDNRKGAVQTDSLAPIQNCRFENNREGTPLILHGYGAPRISDCVFIGNDGSSGGAIGTGYGSGARIERSVFLNNWSWLDGGAIDSAGGAPLDISDSHFVGNFAGGFTGDFGSAWPTRGFAGAISHQGFLRLTNCTVYGNQADARGGVGTTDGGVFRNTIIWGNWDENGFLQSSQLSATAETPPKLSHSIVQGWTGSLGGVGNSGMDPLFVDPDGADDVLGTEDDDLRLSPDSPAIDAGDPDFTAQADQIDLDGHARVLCGRVDIGAYEFGIGDYDCNRTVNLTDFASWQDCMTGPSGSSLRGFVAPSLRRSTSPPLRRSVAESLRRYSQTPSPCAAFDFNADTDVDLADFAQFSDQLTNKTLTMVP